MASVQLHGASLSALPLSWRPWQRVFSCLKNSSLRRPSSRT